LSNIHLLLEIAIEEHTFHVHVMDFSAVVRRHSQHQAHRLQARDGSKHFIVVDRDALDVSLRHESLCTR
jgi:hypothetical protein